MNKKYVVRLSAEECGVCQEIIKNLKGSSQKFGRVRAVLSAGGPIFLGFPADGPAFSFARTRPEVRLMPRKWPAGTTNRLEQRQFSSDTTEKRWWVSSIAQASFPSIWAIWESFGRQSGQFG